MRKTMSKYYKQTAQAAKKKRTYKNTNKQKLVLLVSVSLIVISTLGTVALYNRANAYQPGGTPPGPPYVVALDAGHGGADVGAVGVIQEIDLTQPTVDYLYTLLASDANYKPVLCRKLDDGATLTERVNKANRHRATLLLSVHGNSSEDASAGGFECFPAPPGRDWHSESMRFATLIAQQMGQQGSVLRGENGVRFAYYNQSTSDGTHTGKFFRESSDTTIFNEESFTIVEKANCPAVLAEQCFVTNSTDVEKFGTQAGCEAAAKSYYLAICEYFGTQPILQD